MAIVFAFGSNLSIEQMGKRCRSTRFIARARLHRSELAFAGYSSGWNGAVATIVSQANGVTFGAIYKVSQRDLATLDRFEGVPYAYTRETRKVRLDNGKQLRAQAYVLRRPLGIPSTSYVAVIAAAYVRLGYSTKSIGEAIIRSNDPDWDPDREHFERMVRRNRHKFSNVANTVERRTRERDRDDSEAFDQWVMDHELGERPIWA